MNIINKVSIAISIHNFHCAFTSPDEKWNENEREDGDEENKIILPKNI